MSITPQMVKDLRTAAKMKEEKGCHCPCGEDAAGSSEAGGKAIEACGKHKDRQIDDAKACGPAPSQEPCPVLAARRSGHGGGACGFGHERQIGEMGRPGLEQDLISETLKWQGKAEDLFSRVSGDAQFLENISAYIRDSHYFLEKGDLIRAFEAVIWAWAWMEIGLEKDILQELQKLQDRG